MRKWPGSVLPSSSASRRWRANPSPWPSPRGRGKLPVSSGEEGVDFGAGGTVACAGGEGFGHQAGVAVVRVGQVERVPQLVGDHAEQIHAGGAGPTGPQAFGNQAVVLFIEPGGRVDEPAAAGSV